MAAGVSLTDPDVITLQVKMRKNLSQRHKKIEIGFEVTLKTGVELFLFSTMIFSLWHKF